MCSTGPPIFAAISLTEVSLGGAYVERGVLAGGQVCGGGEKVGPDDVGDVGVAAGLMAVAVDGEGLAGVPHPEEVGDDEHVGALGSPAWGRRR